MHDEGVDEQDMLGRVEGASDSSQEEGGEFGHGVWVVVVLIVGMRLNMNRDGERCDRCADEY